MHDARVVAFEVRAKDNHGKQVKLGRRFHVRAAAEQMREMAIRAGYRDVEVLPIHRYDGLSL